MPVSEMAVIRESRAMEPYGFSLILDAPGIAAAAVPGQFVHVDLRPCPAEQQQERQADRQKARFLHALRVPFSLFRYFRKGARTAVAGAALPSAYSWSKG